MDGIATASRSDRATVAVSGAIEFANVDGLSVVTRLRSGNPLKLLVPRHRQTSAWVISSNLGGGLLAGDAIDLAVTCRAGAIGFLGTQGSTKIYRSDSGATARQSLRAGVEPNGMLVLLPDPVTCYADARYEQHQRFDLSGDASLVLLDWFTCGRLARGERWAMDRYKSVNEIHRDGKMTVFDALRLDRADGPIDGPFRMGRFNCLATVFLSGAPLREFAEAILTSVQSEKLHRGADGLVSAGRINADTIVLRLAGVSVEQVGRELKQRLDFLTHLLGEDPWARKW